MRIRLSHFATPDDVTPNHAKNQHIDEQILWLALDQLRLWTLKLVIPWREARAEANYATSVV